MITIRWFRPLFAGEFVRLKRALPRAAHAKHINRLFLEQEDGTVGKPMPGAKEDLPQFPGQLIPLGSDGAGEGIDGNASEGFFKCYSPAPRSVRRTLLDKQRGNKTITPTLARANWPA